MPPFGLRASRRHEEVLRRIQLPDGSISPGLLIKDGTRVVLVLYSREDVHLGDEVAVSADRTFTVTSVRESSVGDRPVTELDVRAT